MSTQQRVIVITGASDGIGAEAARQVASRVPRPRLILVGRSPEKTAAAAREIGAEYHIADYERFDDVRRLAADILHAVDRIDVLANNAGGIFGDRAVTADGNEKTFQVNHLAPFLLTNLLLERLKAGKGGVINTSSVSARFVGRLDLNDLNHASNYAPMRAYGDAKLANILFARGLDTRYRDSGINAAAFEPGNVRTNFGADSNELLTRVLYRTPLSRLALTSPRTGGSHLAHFLTSQPGVDWGCGRFYARTKPASPRQTNNRVHDDILINELWSRSVELTGLATD